MCASVNHNTAMHACGMSKGNSALHFHWQCLYKTIDSWFSCVSLSYDAPGKFGEHAWSQNCALSNSCTSLSAGQLLVIDAYKLTVAINELWLNLSEMATVEN